MKKIIFFDGDGTLWYPRSTKHSCAPHWIYKNPETSKNPDKYLIFTPTAKSALKKLKQLNIITVVLSTHPYPSKEAQKVLRKKIDYPQLTNYFNEIYATPNYYEAKGEFMINILKQKNMPKSQALMIGDSYIYDYKPAKDNKIEALLIKTDYLKHPNVGRVRRKIRKLKDIFVLYLIHQSSNLTLSHSLR